MNAEELKVAAAREALREVRTGMSLGLGTGSTAEQFVNVLGKALAAGELRDIRCTCTSKKTEEQARSLSIPVHPLADVSPLDLAIDGADEIDANLRLIKGRGGALLRTSVMATHEREHLDRALEVFDRCRAVLEEPA